MKLLGLAFVVFLLGLPLLGPRFIPTHDGEYHIIRFMEFYTMLSQGYVFPRWAPTLNSGFGIPIFLFHYPFPNYVGSLFHFFGFQFVDAFKLALFSGYALAGGFCFLFLSKLWDKRSAFFGTIASLTVPYWFVDIYVRGSVGEVWALAWMFASLAAIVWKKRIFVSISVTLLILSHNVQALLFLPTIILFAWFKDRRSIWPIVLGVVLSAYFWIPAIVERSFVVGLSTVSPLDHFASVWELLVPSWGSEFSGKSIIANKMSFQIGIIPLVWLILAGWRYVALAAIIVFFMLPVSYILWTTVPGMIYIQYPWRLLSFFIPIVGVSAVYVAQRISNKTALVLSILSIVLVYSYARPVLYERRDDAYYQSRGNFTDGTSSMGNAFSTIWTPWKSQKAESLVEVSEGTASIIVDEQRLLFTKITVDAQTPIKMKINRLYFPGWEVYDNGKSIVTDHETDGLIHVLLVSGKHDVVVRFEETSVRRIGDAVSISGLLWLLGWAILERIYAYRHKHISYDERTQSARYRALHKRTHKRAR